MANEVSAARSRLATVANGVVAARSRLAMVANEVDAALTWLATVANGFDAALTWLAIVARGGDASFPFQSDLMDKEVLIVIDHVDHMVVFRGAAKIHHPALIRDPIAGD